MTRFQAIFLGILVLLGVVGVAVFALSKNQGSGTAVDVTLWGTVPSSAMNELVGDLDGSRGEVTVTYVEKSRESFESDLISALASGIGPDLVLLPQDLILKQADKFYEIPFENYPARAFKDSFIGEGELYLSSTGVRGIPFSIDPMVMYWNRDMFATNGLAKPLTTWTEFIALSPKFIKKDARGNVLSSLIALGEVRNISHAKDILALLALQAGTPIIGFNQQGALVNAFDMRVNGLVPAEEALSFFTEFSNPNKALYSWNRAMPSDRSAFLGERLGVYLGYASELRGLREGNPNLNFDVALVPQTGGAKKLTFGRMEAFAILKSSPKIGPAYLAATTLSSAPYIEKWSQITGLPPVRRDLLTTTPSDPYKEIFNQSALVSGAWLDPYREATDGIFMRLVEDVTSGKYSVSESVIQASTDLSNVIRALNQ